MIRGVAITFGLVVIFLAVVGSLVVGAKVLDWFGRRREVRRLTRRGERP